MKFRKDFVTNSSSSSFICDVCGRDESGYDLCLSDIEMCRCKNGHTFCEDERVNVREKSKEEMIAEILKNEWNIREEWSNRSRKYIKVEVSEATLREMNKEDLYSEYYDDEYDRYEIPAEQCPICSFHVATTRDISAYLKKKINLTEKELLKQWKDEFGTYDNFKKWLKA